MRSTASEDDKRDLFYGQLVIIVARWFLILGGVVLVLWTANDVSSIALPIGVMGALMLLNFCLHARYLTGRPANRLLVYLASCLDLTVITILVAAWSQGTGRGLSSPFFVFYYPELLAVGLVLPPRLSLLYAALAAGGYLLVVALISGLGGLGAQKDLTERLITMLAASGLGAYYWRVARRAAGERKQALPAEVKRLLARGGA